MPLNAGNALSADLIGLSLPMNDRYERVSKRIEFGALLAQEKTEPKIELALLDDNCDAALVPDLIKKFIDAKAIVGLPCFKVATEIARTLKNVNNPAPILTLRTRNFALKRLREIEKLPIIEFSNVPDAEARAVVDFILPQFGAKPYAILDDGSVYGRGLADAVRLIAEETGRKPIINSNFRALQSNQRALLRRLQKSGVEAIFVAAEPEDVVTIANDLSALNLNWPIAMGEQIALLPYANDAKNISLSILAVAPAIRKVLDEKFKTDVAKSESSPDPEIVLGYVMVEVATQLIKDTNAREFDTIVGKIKLRQDSRIVLEPFELVEWSNGQLSSVESN